MHISLFHISVIIGILAIIACLIWLAKVFSKRESNRRERFAFAALASLTSLATVMIAALAHNESLWGMIANLIRELRGIHPTPEPAHLSDHILMVIVFGLFLYAVLQIYEKWDGALSERQYQKSRYLEPMPLFSEGLYEAKRVLTRQPAPELHVSQRQLFQSALESPRDILAWHVHARDLICLRSPSYEIDVQLGWHHEQHCWIGINKRSSAIVAIRCATNEIAEQEVIQFVDYVTKINLQAAKPTEHVELFLAIRDANQTGNYVIANHEIRKESEHALLEGLVDFSDYFSDIAYRATKHPLPDSAQTLDQVYTPTSCIDENTKTHSNVEDYLESWLAESGQRQLALLGEYGQGKSTTALMFTNKLIKTRTKQSRIPILIELRGKSPRNMTPEEILAAWAYPYRIDPFAVMKLLMAGRVFLILEGFDEMALVGDAEARLAHFRTLWQFCYGTAKILITGRPNFFLDDQEMRAALGIKKSVGAGPYCEALQLQPFTIDQIKDALRATPVTAREEILELAKSDAEFREIVARGSLLYLVSQLWERGGLSEFKGRINSSLVIGLFIDHSYRRQTAKTTQSTEFMVLTETERRFFTDGVATYMGVHSLPNQISREDFEKVIKTLYQVIPDSTSIQNDAFSKYKCKPLRQRLASAEDAITDVTNDVRSGGILVMDQTKSGALRFAHKSFAEFLIARVYADRILNCNREYQSALLTTYSLGFHVLGKESIKFLAELLVANIEGGDQVRDEMSIARRLFDLIVVRPYGDGAKGRILGKLALAETQYLVTLNQQMQRLSGHYLGSLISLLIRMSFLYLYPRQILVLLLFAPWLILTFLARSLAHTQSERMVAIASATIALCAVFLLIQARANRSSRSPLFSSPIYEGFGSGRVRFWFTCCMLGNVPHHEIEQLISPISVEMLQKYGAPQRAQLFWSTLKATADDVGMRTR